MKSQVSNVFVLLIHAAASNSDAVIGVTITITIILGVTMICVTIHLVHRHHKQRKYLIAFVPKTNNSDTPHDTTLETGIINSLIAPEAKAETNLDPDANRELLLPSCDAYNLSMRANSFSLKNYPILKEAVEGAINSDTTAITPSIFLPHRKSSLNVLCSETASHTPTPSDPQRELPPRETNTLTLHDDTVSLVSDGEHDGHKIMCSLETTIPYDPTPISLCCELQELYSPLSNSSEGLTDCA